MTNSRCAGLSRGKRSALGGAVVVQVSLLAAALFDIRRRPKEAINGPKPLWTAISFVNFVGPICYFVFGRKR